MSTRGCVAIGTEKKWKGYYNHSDSYPSGLGKIAWEYMKHGKINDAVSEGVDLMFSSNPDPLYIEWIYIYNSRTNSMIILHSLGFSAPMKAKVLGSFGYSTRRIKGGYWDYGTYRCKHFKVCELLLEHKEPDWEHIEKNAVQLIHENLFNKAISKLSNRKKAMLFAELLKTTDLEDEIWLIDKFVNESKR